MLCNCAETARPALTTASSAERLGPPGRRYPDRPVLSDGMLKDIGRSRVDVEAEVSKPFWDDPLNRH